MLILVRHAPPFRRWHRRLGERLAAAGHSVRFEAADAVGRRLLALQRRLHGVKLDWDTPETAPTTQTFAPELTLVLSGRAPATGPVVTFEVNGASGERALLAATRTGQAPTIAVHGRSEGAIRLIVAGRPAIEDALVSARALETLLPRLVTLLVQAVARLEANEVARKAVFDDRPAIDGGSAVGYLVGGVGKKLARRFGRARGRPEHWRLALGAVGEAAWTPLPDDRARFRADPFLFEDAGRLWLFTEDYPYATGKGVIACQPVDPPPHLPEATGELAAEPGVVLEEAFHLSYPLVLRHRDAIYMLPETSAVQRVQLYRAAPFPHRWVPDVVLIEGRRLADATPVFHEGRWWLFATSIDDGGSSWDQLHLFHAPDLLGSWTPHPGNPVLIDAGAARPAGLMWHEEGVLLRPAQDCRTGYGVGVAICRVERLDEGGYRQSVVRRIEPPPGATGLHTLNRAAGREVVDLKVPHPR